MAHLEFLASELLIQIFDSLSQVEDVLSLGATCHRFHDIQTSSSQLRFLEHAAEKQYGPIVDAVQLLTQNNSQAVHTPRQVNISQALLKQIVSVGSIADKWADLYPFKKWKDDFENRRLLTTEERRRVRRAVYRLWMYGRAFHTPLLPRETRLVPQTMRKRAELLYQWSTDELAEIADVRAVMREVISSNVCPSNGTVTRKFRQRHGDDAVNHLVFNMTNIHLNFPPPQPDPPIYCPLTSGHFAARPPNQYFHSSTYISATTRTKAYHLGRHGADAGFEGWGDSINHYYAVEDMLKLDPRQILWLKEKKMPRGQVLEWVQSIGEWFSNYGDTWGETVQHVLDQRGENLAEVFMYGGVVPSESDVEDDDDD
jgi:hypothetical protein